MIEINCNKCKNCTGNECLIYGQDVSISIKKCVDDQFCNYIEKQDYELEYDEFWKDIVENKDSTINRDQLMRELFDMRMLIKNCTQAYYLVSNGNISKPNTEFFEVESLFNKNFLNKNYIKDDILDMITGCIDFEELKEELKDYFELDDED